MCGRYTLSSVQHPRFVDSGVSLMSSFNISPTQSVWVLNERAELCKMNWRFSPIWAKPIMRLYNARSETLRKKPSFQGAKRCVFLADGWFEWCRVEKIRTPYYHHLNGQLIYFGGIYNEESGCAIVTTEAKDAPAAIHHRQPVLLDPSELEAWLQGQDLFASKMTLQISVHRVSNAVNNPLSMGPSLILPLALGVEETEQSSELSETLDLFD